jgi:hypothetical protein
MQPPASNNKTASGYSRAIPERFSSDSDDLFIRSMISSYATEGENKDGSSDGVFTMTDAQAKTVTGASQWFICPISPRENPTQIPRSLQEHTR